MVPTQRDSQLCLLLLLGLMGMVISFHAPPGGLTWAQWFEVQHVNMTNARCKIAMQLINRLNYESFWKPCKPQNTFIRTPLAAVVNLCYTTNITCRDRISTNCHRSPVAVNLIYCNLTGQAVPYNQCEYQQLALLRNYSVGCNRRNCPVHFDRIY
ncbi:non-secretory ribonuclease-like [Pipistrellus kuhlii]|uniref:non-secretory ribonuclease-like n=1 Tax=Pipistrellus kuhlii TaxID=59472 RepID=UPI00174F13CD|nr:non-secretory ribonuclease-like [Pipistrellus kuhlii]